MRELSAELGIADRVVWAGQVKGTMKQSALAAAEIFVLPSFSENFGIAAVEAMAAGLPVILGQGVAVAAEVAAAEAGMVVSPEPDSIAQAMRALFLDERRRLRAGANARAFAEEVQRKRDGIAPDKSLQPAHCGQGPIMDPFESRRS